MVDLLIAHPIFQLIFRVSGVSTVALAFWADGVFCLAINALPPKGGDWVNHVQGIYRLWTQPGQWLLMALLAGWLLEGVLAIIGTWWPPAWVLIL